MNLKCKCIMRLSRYSLNHRILLDNAYAIIFMRPFGVRRSWQLSAVRLDEHAVVGHGQLQLCQLDESLVHTLRQFE